MLHEVRRSPSGDAERAAGRVVLVKRIRAGDGVSYGHTFVAPSDGWIALVAIGYGDGVHRKAGNRASAAIRGERFPIVGRVAMNALVLWLGDDRGGVVPGDEAVLFGDGPGEPRLEDWARAVGEDPRAVAAGFGRSAEPEGAAWIDVDLEAYQSNVRLLRDRVAPAELMAVVKSDAYGHGAEAIATAAVAEGVSRFGVLDVPTAREVRLVAPDAQLFVWLWSADELPEALALGADLGVSSVDQLGAVTAAARAAQSVARAHLKIDTGLGRAGAREEDWPALLAAAREAEATGALLVAGVWTHIAEVSAESDSASIERFAAAAARAERTLGHAVERHLAASAAAYAREDARFDVVRIGAFGYGIAPGGGIGPAALGLEPVMALRARVTATEHGIATLGIGTRHGLPAAEPGQLAARAPYGPVAIAGVELDRTVLVAPGARVGDIVTLFGTPGRGEPTLQEWADALGTIGEELAVRLSPAIERRYRAD